MDSSAEELRKREEEDVETSAKNDITYHSYGPCFHLEQVIKAFLKCLGLDSTTEQAIHASSETERVMKTTEEFAVMSTRSINVSTRPKAYKKPPRPPISSGGGGQTNSSSSS